MGFWQWFHRWGSPKWFYETSQRLMPWFAIGAAILIIPGIIWGLLFAPEDYLQGNSFRIIYIHVPAAATSMSCYAVMATAAFVAVVWKMKLGFLVVRALAPFGALLAFICLITGSIWGKPTWGTWWEWDARLTSMLFLLFLYIGIIALANAIESEQSGDKAIAILTLVGVVNLPIIKYSVEFVNTLHQPATLNLLKESTIAPEMKYPLLMALFGFFLLLGWIAMARTSNEVLRRERKARWVKDLVTGKS